MDPDVFPISFKMSLHKLDLPEPDSPTIPNVSPSNKEKLILSTAYIKIEDLNKPLESL